VDKRQEHAGWGLDEVLRFLYSGKSTENPRILFMQNRSLMLLSEWSQLIPFDVSMEYCLEGWYDEIGTNHIHTLGSSFF
jgi:hypothetical protein